jgi:hypothetical protein
MIALLHAAQGVRVLRDRTAVIEAGGMSGHHVIDPREAITAPEARAPNVRGDAGAARTCDIDLLRIASDRLTEIVGNKEQVSKNKNFVSDGSESARARSRRKTEDFRRGCRIGCPISFDLLADVAN